MLTQRYSHDMRGIEIRRAMTSTDISEVGRLLDVVAHANGRRPLSDHLYLDLVNGGTDGFIGFVVSDPGADHPVAYAQVSRANDSFTFGLVVDPRHRDEFATIGAGLIGNALEMIASDGGGSFTWWVFEPEPVHTTLASNAGLRPARTLYQMRRPLPTGMPVTIETRAFVPGADDEAWVQVNNRAFADHGEQGGWTTDTLRQRQREDWFDAEGFRVHDIDGRMAGFCWTKVHQPTCDEDPAIGEIYVIAVDPDFHGRGLGTQLTLAGLDHLAERDITIGMLYVDADNATAVGMYEHLGFRVHHTDTAFVAHVPAASRASE